MPAQKRWRENALVLKDFSGGENSTDSPIKLLPQELSECRNVVPDMRGAIQKRKGITKYNSTEVAGVASSSIVGLARFYREATTAVVVAVANYGGGEYRIYDVPSSGAATNLGASGGYGIKPNGPHRVHIVQYRDRLYG